MNSKISNAIIFAGILCAASLMLQDFIGDFLPGSRIIIACCVVLVPIMILIAFYFAIKAESGSKDSEDLQNVLEMTFKTWRIPVINVRLRVHDIVALFIMLYKASTLGPVRLGHVDYIRCVIYVIGSPASCYIYANIGSFMFSRLGCPRVGYSIGFYYVLMSGAVQPLLRILHATQDTIWLTP